MTQRDMKKAAPKYEVISADDKKKPCFNADECKQKAARGLHGSMQLLCTSQACADKLIRIEKVSLKRRESSRSGPSMGMHQSMLFSQ